MRRPSEKTATGLGLLLGLFLFSSSPAEPPVGLESHAVPAIKARQSDWVNAVALSPSGSSVGIGVLGQVGLLSCPDAQDLGNGSGHSKYVQGLAFSPDGTVLYSIGWDGLLCRWMIDLPDRMEASPSARKHLAAPKPQCLAVFSDGTRVVTNGKDSTLDVFDAVTLQRIAELAGLGSTATCVAVDAVRGRIVAGDNKGTLAVWSIDDRKLLKSWGAHGDKITGLAVDVSTGGIVSGDGKGELKLWDPEKFKDLRKADFKETIRGLQTSPDGRFLYVALKSGAIRMLDCQFSEAAGALVVSGRPNCLALDGGGRYLACGTDGNELYVWDLLSIREVQIAYDIPARLEIEVDFDDSGALIPNRALDGGEKVKLVCRVKNVGQGTAYDTRLNVTCDNRNVSFTPAIELGDLLAGSVKTVDIPLDVALDANDSKAEFVLHVAEKKKNDARTALGISVRYLPKPDLTVTHILLHDTNSGSTSGNGNGIPENDETVEAEIFLTNNGAGPAWRNRLVMTSHTPGTIPLIDSVDLPAVPAGGSTSGRLRIQIPKTFTGASLAIAVQATDAVTGARAEDEKTWQTKQNVPTLVADWRIIQELRNGRPGRLQLRLENKGTLGAENIRITITNNRGLVISQPAASIPRIDAGATDPGLPFDVVLPREFQAGKVEFQASITQDNFAGATFTKIFDVLLSRPELKIQGLPADMTLTRGDDLYLDLYLQNDGDLDAEDVKVMISAPKLDLYETQSLGRVGSGGGIGTVDRISWPVKTGIETGPIELKVVATQLQFDPVEVVRRPEIVAERYTRNEIQATAPSGGLLAGGTGNAAGPGAGRGPSGGIELEFLNFQDPVRDANYALEILVNAPQGIRGIMATLNGLPVYNLDNNPADRIKLEKARGQYLNTEIRLRNLGPGQANELEFIVVGEGTGPQSFARTLRYEPLDFQLAAGLDPGVDVNVPPVTGRRNPNAVALLIGIADYLNPGVQDLEFAEQDVLAVKQTLINTLGYDEDNIIVLLNKDANKSDMQIALEYTLKNRVEQLDRPDVFVYFSGHGAPGNNNKTGYLLPQNGNPAPDVISISGYSTEEVSTALASLDAGSVTVVIDACFSGRSLNPLQKTTGVKVKGLTGGGENCVVFSASAGDETSIEYPAMMHGLFTYFFLKGLQGEAVGDSSRRKRNEVTAGDLQKYLSRHVPATSREMQNTQTPQLIGRTDRKIADGE